MPKPLNPKADLLSTIFIDPWRREVTLLKIGKELHEWHKALDSDVLDSFHIFELLPNGNAIDVWVDDLGQLREPPLATFILRDTRFYGYGLLFEVEVQSRDTVSVSFDLEFLKNSLCLTMEEWEKRLKPADYLEQMTRVIEWEPWFHKV